MTGAQGVIPPGEMVVTQARDWLGTPYLHQASVRGSGCDCLGLIRGVWRALYGEEPCAVPAYTADWDEVARADLLRHAASELLQPVEIISPGVVLLFRMRRDAVAKHLGIVSGPDSFIHAYSGHGVVETSLTDPWRRRIDSCFAFPAASDQ